MRPLLAPLALLALSAAAVTLHAETDACATAPATCATIINTHATATTRLPNTAVDVAVTITLSGRDLLTVQHDLASRADSLLAYLRAQKTQRLVTTSVSFSPSTRTQKNAPDKTVGYDATSSVSFRTTPANAPALLGGVLDHGASSVDSVVFTPTEEEIVAARQDLSAQATKTAIAQAGSVAAAAGLHVAAVRSINVQGGSMVRPQQMAMPMMARMSVAQAEPVETAPGDTALSISVDVTAAATR